VNKQGMLLKGESVRHSRVIVAGIQKKLHLIKKSKFWMPARIARA
jgi:hypothetical protein